MVLRQISSKEKWWQEKHWILQQAEYKQCKLQVWHYNQPFFRTRFLAAFSSSRPMAFIQSLTELGSCRNALAAIAFFCSGGYASGKRTEACHQTEHRNLATASKTDQWQLAKRLEWTVLRCAKCAEKRNGTGLEEHKRKKPTKEQGTIYC